ncbi:ATP-binding cassette domain-containing protein [Billgrantia saliphila]|uniref:ATP-binding cassette domain-containing protein n=1 Tax=Billgrantia saliphila TaxID=1848458 RepID=UPI000CE41F38|nr:ATP-binding cassette domain-containing protein [Halomonas saliphila]
MNNQAPHSLELRDIEIRLDGKLMVALDATVGPGETLTLMGPSGSGKSTLLAFLAGFLPPAFEARGRVVLSGHDITELPAEHRGIGLLFQDPLLFPHLSVAGNLRFGLPRCMSNRAEHIQRALADVGLAGYGERDPATLSGGQKARVALMRLLLSAPSAVLLDEPFSKLDTELRDEMRRLAFSHLQAAGLPSLLVTHDREDANAVAGAVIELSGGR